MLYGICDVLSRRHIIQELQTDNRRLESENQVLSSDVEQLRQVCLNSDATAETNSFRATQEVKMLGSGLISPLSSDGVSHFGIHNTKG